MSSPLLYEVHARQWLAELGARDLAAVGDGVLDALARLGVTQLWLMGVWPTGPRSRRQAIEHEGLRAAYAHALPGWTEDDVAGSPFAIAEYRVADEFGGDAALAALRARLRSRGIGIVLDFVPNHVALDHPWVAGNHVLASETELPDSFRDGDRFVAHGKDPYFPAWTDTAQLDYRKAATRAAMCDVLLAIAERCDGVRCDMAMLVLPDVFARTWGDPRQGASDFWRDAIAAVEAKHPAFTFIAEAYWGLEARLCELGFDFAYDKELYDRIVHDKPAEVVAHVYGAANARGVHFLENHDEPRAAALPIDLHRAAALLVLALPGMRFLHHGQLDGARRFARIQLRRRASEPVDPRVREIYDNTLAALRASSVGQGAAQLLAPQRAWADNASNAYFVVARWPGDLVVVNLAPHRAQCRVDVGLSGTWRLADRLGDEVWERELSQPLFLDLPGRGAQLFALDSALR